MTEIPHWQSPYIEEERMHVNRYAGPLLIALAVVVFTVLFFLPLHVFAGFERYYFTPLGKSWWEGAVWGNVLAIWPSAPVIVLLGAVAYYMHKRAVAPLHEKLDALTEAHVQAQKDQVEHHEKLDRHLAALADALDPGTDSETQLDVIADRTNEATPGGLGTIHAELVALASGNPPPRV